MSRRTGFTLLELLVVIFIISLISTVAVLKITRQSSTQLKHFSEELMQKIQLAEDQAMLKPVVLRLTQQGDQLLFLYQRNEDWEAVLEPSLSPTSLPKGVNIQFNDQPAITFSINGGITPFRWLIVLPGQKPAYQLTGDIDGSLTLQAA